MLSLARVVVSSAVAYLAYGLGGSAMLSIPGTPHHRLLQSMFVLQSYRDSPDLDAANAAFDEWLRIGRQAEWIEATILTAIAASAVLLLWRRRPPLSSIETASIIAAFIAGVMWRGGSADLNAPLATAALVFAAIMTAPRIRHFLGRSRAGAVSAGG